MSVLALEKVSKTRGAGRHAVAALTEVTLTLGPGEFVLLEGPSGSGKTTLLAVAAGILTASGGKVSLAGEDLAGLAPAAKRALRARKVGFVYQRSNLLAGLTARENVLVAASLARIADAGREADALLAELGVAELADRKPGDLSGGEEQRIAVARALVHRPSLVLADEPTASLDGKSGQAVAERLRAMSAARGAAVLVATHDERLHPFATRRVRLVDGKIA